MSRGPRIQLNVLTWFLGAAGVVTAIAIMFGSGPDREFAAAMTTTTTMVDTTLVDAPDPPTPTAAAATTTTAAAQTAIAPLELFTAADIQASITPRVAFVTTFNGSGSGVLVGNDIVVTNAHVIWPFTTVGVLFPGDSRRAGRVIGIDPRADLAFIQVESPRLPHPLPPGSSRDLVDGDVLYVVGYPAAADFTPDPTVDVGPFRAVRKWEFSGASWVQSGSAAIGGQSGGALVDEYGRLVGITTFGSPSDLYSLSIEDVVERLATLDEDGLTSIDERRPPRLGGRRTLDVAFEGPWEQAAFVTWLSPGARSELLSDRSVDWRALDPFGVELDAGSGRLDVFWGLATPGVVLAESSGSAETSVEVTRPLVALDDPDDARLLTAGAGLTGFVDVPGDRDWFYLEVTEANSVAEIVVEAQTRVRIALFDRTTGSVVAEVEHERGFFFDDPALVVEGLAAGPYVVTVEDVGAQFGTYRISVG